METIDELKQSRDTWEHIAQSCLQDLEQQVKRVVELIGENNKVKNENFKLMEKYNTMKKNILKEQPFEWINFHDFIEEIKKIVPETHQHVKRTGLPWSGMFHGHCFTHETDLLYLIGHEQVRFHEYDALCFTAENRPFTLKHPLVDFIK